MGKRKRVKMVKKSNVGANPEGASSSRSSLPAPSSSRRRSLRLNPEATDQSAVAAKKSKTNSSKEDSSNPLLKDQDQGQAGQSSRSRSRVKKATVYNLPAEMLTEILKCVDTRSLFDCRLVSRQWNAISSGILTARSDAQISFNFTLRDMIVKRQGQNSSWYGELEENGIEHFLKCMKKSKNFPCPFFSFTVDRFSHTYKFFDHQHFQAFIKNFASSKKPWNRNQNQNQRQRNKIRGLKFTFPWLFDGRQYQVLAEKLGHLLLKKVPYLEQLVLNFPRTTSAPTTKLFPDPKQPKTNVDKVPASASAPVKRELPHLKVVHFEAPMIPIYIGVAKDLLNAAVNLSRLRVWVTNLEDFYFFDSLGKLHLLREADIEMDPKFFTSNTNYRNYGSLALSCPMPKLESLNLMMSITETDQVIFPRAQNFLENLFKSSKATLTELKAQPIGFLPELRLPTFKCLHKLTVHQHQNKNETHRQRIFPRGIRSRDVFPAVSHLELDIQNWSRAFSQQDSIPLLPKVKTFILTNTRIAAGGISILSLMCPNLKKFQIQKDMGGPPELNLVLVGRSIWTHMKQLESLEVDVDLDLPENNSTVALDSCFTGISIKHCQRLSDLKAADKLLKKWKYPTQILGLDLTAEREHVSILDMKDLKTLRINPYAGNTLLDRKEFLQKLTWVSQEYAFKLLPNLRLNS